MMQPQIIVPCKRFAMGKSRLAAVLGAEERRALCRAFLSRTLDTAAALVPADAIHLVTDDPDAATMAAARGHPVIADGGVGLNAALERARDAVGAAPLMILPTDLVFASITALRSVMSRDFDVVIVPDRQRVGTNVLFLSNVSTNFHLVFGDHSFDRHCRLAHELGLKLLVLDDDDLSFDVDGPADYRRWRRLYDHLTQPTAHWRTQ